MTGVAQEFLDGTDIVTTFQQMSSTAVTQGAAVESFADRDHQSRLFDALPQTVFVGMMPPGFISAWIEGQISIASTICRNCHPKIPSFRPCFSI